MKRKSKKIRILTFLIAAVFMFALLAACNGETDPDETGKTDEVSETEGHHHDSLDNPDVTIVYWQSMNAYINSLSRDENVYDPILGAVESFEEKYGGTVTIDAVNWGDMLPRMTQLQNAGEAPDLVMVYDRTMHPVILNNFVMAIDDYVTDDDYSFWPVSRDLFSWKGSTYAIPIKPYLYYVMFNKDMFDMEGLEHPDELFRQGKWDFENFDRVGRALTRRVDGEVVQYAFTSWTETVSALITSNDGRIVHIDTVNGTARSGLGDTRTQNAMEWIGKWVDTSTGIIMIDDNHFGHFDNNICAMNRGKEFPADDLPFDVGMVPMPAGPDAPPRTVYVYPQALAVPEGADNPAGAAAYVYHLNQRQLEVGDQREANRIGQENYDMIYSDETNFVYAYDKAIDVYDHVEASIVNMLSDGVPPSTIAETLEAQIETSIEKLFGTG